MNKKISTIILAILLGAFSLFGCGRENPDVDMSDFAIPEDFTWEGSYIDNVVGQAVMTIEKSGGNYHVSIGVPNSDMSYMDTYEFEASYDKNAYGLVYNNGARTTYNLPDYSQTEPGELRSTEVYTDGTGAIYYIDGYLYWTDDKDDAGADYTFRDLNTVDASEEEIQAAEDAFLEIIEYNDTESTEAGADDNTDTESTEAGADDNTESNEE